jgi:hypothetical protein
VEEPATSCWRGQRWTNAGSEKLDSDAALVKKNGEVAEEPATRRRSGQRWTNVGRVKLDSDG